MEKLETQNQNNNDTQKWNHIHDDTESEIELSTDESDSFDSDTENENCTSHALGISHDCDSVEAITENLKDLFNSINSVQVGSVKVENSTVHIGNVTNIKNVQIIHASDKCRPRRQRKKDETSPTPVKKRSNEEREECVNSDAFNSATKFKIPKELCAIIPRSTWLAQMPMEDYEFMEEPVEYVVISHTATESSEKQAINIRIIRDTQCFHIESRGWNDIAYNFLVGCDGNIYEGRGWGVVGAHTRGYNTRAIGISFIGCFMRVLPTAKAMNACKNLLQKGVDEGHLAVDYKLICHCQCRSTESPGRKLFEELQNWEHFFHIEEDEEQSGII